MNQSSNSPLSRVWFRVIRLHQANLQAVAGRLKAYGLSVPQFDVISTLTEQEGISQRELADRLYVTKGNVSGLVDRLVEAGLVERRSIPGDRRSHSLYLTQEGRRLAQLGLEAQADFMAATLGKLSESDITQLEIILRKWRDHCRALEAGANE